MTPRLGSFQAAAAALLVLLSLAFLLATCRSRETAFLRDSGAGAWIQAPLPVRRIPVSVDPDDVPTATFEARFSAERIAPDAVLELRAQREVRVELNGRVVAGLDSRDLSGSGGPLREPVAALLVPGENEIRIRVRNPWGPPLLAAALRGVEPALETRPGWQVRLQRPEPLEAIRADDTRLPTALLVLPTPFEGLRRHASSLAGAFVATAVGFAALRGRLGPAARRRLAAAALVATGTAWLALFIAAQARIPSWAGPDAVRHIEYVRHLREHAALPLADELWAGYQPPLFYALTAGLLAAFDPAPDGVAERALLRAIPALATLCNVVLAFLLARLLFPAGRRPLFALLFAACVPAHWLLSVYVSNESLHALLSNAALLLASWMLVHSRHRPVELAALGAMLGLAVLSKVTSLLLVPLAAACVAAHMALRGRRPLAAAGGGAWVVGTAALVAGWFFVRNRVHFGEWLVWNQAVPGGEGFWQEPGFRTARYYLGFGESFHHPYAAAFHSFWDALYSGFWGDGDTAGVTTLEVWRALWDVPAMSAIYLLAVPLTFALGAGMVALVREALRGDDAGRRLAISLQLGALFVIGVALLQRSLAAPYYSFVKASFGLGTLGALALAAACGIDAIHRGLSRLGSPLPLALFYGWWGALVTAMALAVAG